ncbi:dTDP-4-dehydrorhamnose reductase [Candidatus Falkowbacteria bacterium]|nr:dTDP-4-dehydrorhamnose reductase [Candidatus Falkowbacteria bacterium]
MKLLIIGAKGMLGQELAKIFAGHNLYLWDKEEIDITDAGMVDKKLKELRPELIINAAAYNAVDDCETNFDIAKKINADGPVNLAKTAQKISARFVHYSSDYVFDGAKADGYVEYDLPAPISKYGESKYLGEESLEHCENAYLIRTSRLFGLPARAVNAKKSFVEVMLKLADEKPEVEAVNEEFSNPTYVNDLARQTKHIIESDYAPGVYHATNEGSCTWYEFTLEIFKQAGKNVKVLPVPSERFPRPARRPTFSSLKNTKLPRMRSWQEALTDFLKVIGKFNSVNNEKQNDYSSVRYHSENVAPSAKPAGTEQCSVPTPTIQQFQQPQHKPISMATRKTMKGIILSGGKGTRLYPLTKITSKQLLPVYDKPMVMYPLETLMNAGIKDILIIVAPEYAGQYLHLLGSGKEWSVKLSYEVQDEPKGLPEAFIIGENFIGDDNVTMILGDNIFFDHDFTNDIQSFESGGRIFAVQVPDPQRSGVVEFDANGRVLSIEEKPQKPKSNFAIPGIYIYDSRVCHIAKGIKPTWRPETDITEIHKAYLGMNELDVRQVKGRWLDAGTFDSLLQACNLMAAREYLEKIGYNDKMGV